MFSIQRIVGCVGLSAMAAATLMLLPGTAMAANDAHVRFDPARGAAHHLRIVSSERLAPQQGNRTAQADSFCPITVGAYSGGYICGTTVLEVLWSDGRYEIFIVGEDRAIWHIFQRFPGDQTWSGWYSMGGGANNGVFLANNTPTIWIVGLDNNPWCDTSTPGKTPSGWSGWYFC